MSAGPDGRTIYYIVTDATPTGPADMMGVVDAPKLAQTLASCQRGLMGEPSITL